MAITRIITSPDRQGRPALVQAAYVAATAQLTNGIS